MFRWRSSLSALALVCLLSSAATSDGPPSSPTALKSTTTFTVDGHGAALVTLHHPLRFDRSLWDGLPPWLTVEGGDLGVRGFALVALDGQATASVHIGGGELAGTTMTAATSIRDNEGHFDIPAGTYQLLAHSTAGVTEFVVTWPGADGDEAARLHLTSTAGEVRDWSQSFSEPSLTTTRTSHSVNTFETGIHVPAGKRVLVTLGSWAIPETWVSWVGRSCSYDEDNPPSRADRVNPDCEGASRSVGLSQTLTLGGPGRGLMESHLPTSTGVHGHAWAANGKLDRAGGYAVVTHGLD